MLELSCKNATVGKNGLKLCLLVHNLKIILGIGCFFFSVRNNLEIVQQNSFILYEAILLNNSYVELLKLRSVTELEKVGGQGQNWTCTFT